MASAFGVSFGASAFASESFEASAGLATGSVLTKAGLIEISLPPIFNFLSCSIAAF